jgi:hypothetical protein
MIPVLFDKLTRTVLHLGETYAIKAISKADDLTVDIDLEKDGNIWNTSFNAQSVMINGFKWNSSEELLSVLNE